MDFLLYGSAIIAAISLLLIAIFFIIALRNVKKTMSEVSETIARVESKLSGITTKSDQLMERTNKIAADVDGKVQRLESVVQTADHIGKSTENLNRSFQSISQQIAAPEPKHVELMERLTTMTEAASRMYFKFKSEKQKNDRNVHQEMKQLP
ncbi:DUF948 domain-containing protein [Sporosarcina luteola]|uniref:DUF948 domain-containing protein n=1 Tax=Sporosarcina luteola TaxID=582850 RepID=UPI00203FFBD1|nr:DUF948 domain-containing protein [Sporosarcina luteola]MCM3743257.1 DUF948 domain-containing protein [Sporosarcina luteola]